MKKLSSLALLAFIVVTGFYVLKSESVDSNAEVVSFSNAVELDYTTTVADVLKQSDNYKNNALHIAGFSYAFNKNGHPVLQSVPKEFKNVQSAQVTLDQAKQLVIDQLLPKIYGEMKIDTGRELPLIAYAWPELLAAGTVVERTFNNNAPFNIETASWFFVLDLEPNALWGHRAEYVRVDAITGEIVHKRTFSLPADYEIADIHRFYPNDLASLPPQYPWPLEYEQVAPTPEQRDQVGLTAAHNSQKKIVSHDSWRALLPKAAAQTADECAGTTGKKIAILIGGEGPNTTHNDGFVDGEDIARGVETTAEMLPYLGFEEADIHRMNPETHKTVKDLYEGIEKLGKNLGPCDKFFVYMFAHGTIVDKDNDDKPDVPSESFVYGHGKNKETMFKFNYGDTSFPKALSTVKAGTVNVVIESCYAGSLTHYIEHDLAGPPEGSDWHFFLAASDQNPSYASRNETAHYTQALRDCVMKKILEGGFKKPTIAEIEAIMRSCQTQLVTNPTTVMAPVETFDVQPQTITISPKNIAVVEGNEGVQIAQFTITRSNVNRTTPVRFETRTNVGWLSNAEATPVQDYGSYRNGLAQFIPGRTDRIVTLGVVGETEIESDEDFIVNFPQFFKEHTVTITNDDGKDTESSVDARRKKSHYVFIPDIPKSTTPSLDMVGRMLADEMDTMRNAMESAERERNADNTEENTGYYLPQDDLKLDLKNKVYGYPEFKMEIIDDPEIVELKLELINESSAEATKMVEVIEWGSYLIPVDQVHEGQGPECDKKKHWHANVYDVVTLNGTVVHDPAGGGCGFGTLSEVPSKQVPDPRSIVRPTSRFF